MRILHSFVVESGNKTTHRQPSLLVIRHKELYEVEYRGDFYIVNASSARIVHDCMKQELGIDVALGHGIKALVVKKGRERLKTGAYTGTYCVEEEKVDNVVRIAGVDFFEGAPTKLTEHILATWGDRDGAYDFVKAKEFLAEQRKATRSENKRKAPKTSTASRPKTVRAKAPKSHPVKGTTP